MGIGANGMYIYVCVYLHAVWEGRTFGHLFIQSLTQQWPPAALKHLAFYFAHICTLFISVSTFI